MLACQFSPTALAILWSRWLSAVSSLLYCCLAARGRDFSDILPNLGVMALAGYRLLPSLQLLYAQLTQVSSMRHAVDEVYDEFVAAETDKSIPRVISTEPVTPASPFRWNNAITLCEVSLSLSRRIAASIGRAFRGDSRRTLRSV